MAYHWPSRYIADLAFVARLRRPVGHAELLAQLGEELLPAAAGEIADGAVIRQDLHLVVGKRHRDERAGVPFVAALPQFAARARRAGGAMMAVGDVEGRHLREQIDELPRVVLASRRPDGVMDVVRCGEVEQRRCRT